MCSRSSISTVPEALEPARLQRGGRSQQILDYIDENGDDRGGAAHLSRRAPRRSSTAPSNRENGEPLDRLHGPYPDDGGSAAVSERARSRKTVNMPTEATVEEIEDAPTLQAWQLGRQGDRGLSRRVQARLNRSTPAVTRAAVTSRPSRPTRASRCSTLTAITREVERLKGRRLRRMPAQAVRRAPESDPQVRASAATRGTSPSGCTRMESAG